MKKLIIVLGILFITTSATFAQTPQSFKYQAVARDDLGNLITNQDVGIRINILEGSATGTAVYTETQLPHTNQFGLLSINIGEGTVVTGDFSTISWGTNTYFIKTELDPAGGSTYMLMGTSQLLSVPYALYSENTENVNDADADPNNEIQTLSKVSSLVTLSNGGGSFTDEVNDADADPNNEIQTLTKVGKNIELSDGGGSVIDEVNDIDADPYNELQTISKNNLNITLSDGGGTVNIADDDNDPANELQTLTKSGSTIKLSDGGSVIDEVDDADNNPANEFQTIAKVGSTVTLSNSGGSFTDAVNDADNNPTNEIQTLSLNGSNLTISNGNTVGLPSGLPTGSLGRTLYYDGTNWLSTNNLYNNGTNIGIGTTLPSVRFEVNKPVNNGLLSYFKNTAIGAGSVALKSHSVYDTWGYLAVQGDDPFDGHTGLNIDGDEVGVLGISTGSSATDNYGIYGYSNGIAVYAENSLSGQIGYLGGTSYGAYGKFTTSRYGYLGGSSYGAYGQYDSNRFGYLGGSSYGAYGRYSSTRYGYLGGSSYGAYGQYSTSRYGYLGGSNYSVYGRYSSNVWGGLGNANAGVDGNSTNSGQYAYAGRFTASENNEGCKAVRIYADYTGSNPPPTNNKLYGIYNAISSTKSDCYAIYNQINHTGTVGFANGTYVYLDVAANHSTWAVGVGSSVYRDNDSDASFAFKARAVDGTTTYGLHSQSYNGNTNYGVYATGHSGTTNYAGYFTGNLAYTGTLSNPSDKKFKENLSPINNPLNKIKQLNIYSYDYKNTGEASKMNFSEGRQFGFIAQELESIFPELVSDEVHSYHEVITKEGEGKTEDHSFKYKGINYIGMIPILTQAIKDQQNIIETQQSAIEKQQKEIDELRLIVQQLVE